MPRPAARFRTRTLLRALAPLLLMLLLAGCLLPPEPETKEAKSIFDLYVAVLVMGGAVFVGVEGFIIYAIFRYRRRDDRLPEQHHGNNLIEVLWTAIPTVIVLILFVISMFTLGAIQTSGAEPGVTIEVRGFQWQWTFRYLDDDADPDNDYSTTGSLAAPPVMVVPVGQPVRLVLSASDVVHSFYVPQFLVKRDLFPLSPGQEPNRLEFTVTEAGTYSGQCAEFCGDLHARMTFSVQAMAPADFAAWLESPAPSAAPGTTVVKISADQIAFDLSQIEVPAGEPFVIEFANLEAVPHNVEIYLGNESIFSGEIITGPATISYQVPALEAGEYVFQCVVHPIAAMTGTLIAK
jgi:cytochrome c oxidase subunit II